MLKLSEKLEVFNPKLYIILYYDDSFINDVRETEK